MEMLFQIKMDDTCTKVKLKYQVYGCCHLAA